MSELPQLFRRASEYFGSLVEQIRDDQWSAPTPCTDWDVRSLVRHLVNEDLWAPPLFDGATIESVGNRFEGDILGGDPKDAWRQAHKGALASIEEEGAMERTVHLSWGDEKGEEYTLQLTLDHLVHGWDLARGIGGDDHLDPEITDYMYSRWKDRSEMIRGAGVFGDQQDVPESAGTQTKLLALLGRKG